MTEHFPASRSYPALRIKSRSRGRRRDGRKRSGSKQSSVLEALAVAQLSDSILNECNSPIEATLEEEDDGERLFWRTSL